MRGSYLFVCAIVATRDLAPARTALRGLLLDNQRRLHFTDERPARRRDLLARLAELELAARVYECRAREPQARPAVLRRALEDLGDLGVQRLVIESRAGRDRFDRETIRSEQRAGSLPQDLAYEHLLPHEEPLLWVADGVAWAWGAGGDWRRRVEPIVERHERVDP
jgi:hypothetical protein